MTAPPARVAATSNAGPAESAGAAYATSPTAPSLDPRVPTVVARAAADLATAADQPTARPDPIAQPTWLDGPALEGGFANGGYAFRATLAGLANLDALSSTVTGRVVDPSHFVLEFPGSASIGQYERDGDTATARIGDHLIPVEAGGGAFGTLSPEDLLPARLWSMAIGPFVSTLRATDVPGDYAAVPSMLRAAARHVGYTPEDWTLTARVDAEGRLIAADFAGTTWGAPFHLALGLTYP